MIKVLIADHHSTAREHLTELLQNEENVQVIGEAGDCNETRDLIRILHPDLVFWNIRMPGFGTHETLETLAWYPVRQVIFILDDDKKAIKPFNHHDLNVLYQPVDGEKCREMLTSIIKSPGEPGDQAGIDSVFRRLFSELPSNDGPPFLSRIPLGHNRSIRFLDVSDLICCQAESHAVRLFTDSDSHLINERLENLEEMLDPKLFVRINRSCLVRIKAIHELHLRSSSECRIVLINNRDYLVSQQYHENLMKILKM